MNKTQLKNSSNGTYTSNGLNQITAATVRTFNDTFIDSVATLSDANVFTNNQVVSGTLGVVGNVTVTGTIKSTQSPLVSGSAQITYSGISNIPNGIISSSAQLPSGTVSGSAQVDGYYGIDRVSGSTKQFLNKLGQFDNIEAPVGGYASNLYLSNTASDIPTYETLTYTAPGATVNTETVNALEGEKLLHTYLYASGVATDSFPSGLWSFTFYGKLDQVTGVTQLGITYFKRDSDGVETDLFTSWSNEISNLTDGFIKWAVTNPTFTVATTDRMGLRLYARTSSIPDVTISYSIGAGYGAYLNNPDKIRHDQLRDWNGNVLYMHLTQNQIQSYNSYAALIAKKLDTGSFETYTASIADDVASKLSTSSFNQYTSSLSGGYATTGSNVFNGDQVITGSLTVTGNIDGTFVGTIASSSYATYAELAKSSITSSYADNFTVAGTLVAQTLEVQTITSSVVYSSGSNKFGNDVSNTQTFTGSVNISGSLNVNGTIAGMISSSVQVVYTDISNIPNGIISSSAQLPAGIISGSEQLPADIVSGSSQTDGWGFAITGSNSFVGNEIITGSLIITGSVRGDVGALSISSNTASLDLSKGSFFTLSLASGSNTRIEPANIQPGQTVNVLLATTGSATVSFPTSVKQVSGSAYVPTTTTSKDIITFISFDTTSLYLANVKNLI